MAKEVQTLKAREVFKGRILFRHFLGPLRLFCDHCGKYVPSDTRWRCSYCDEIHTECSLYSFLYQCSNCAKPAKAFACLHCQKVNPLDTDKDSSHPARLIRTTPPVLSDIQSPPPTREDQKLDLKHRIEVAQLDAELARVTASADLVRKKSSVEKLEESFAEHDAQVVAAQRIAAREKAKNAERYKSDPELLEKANEAVDVWLSGQV